MWKSFDLITAKQVISLCNEMSKSYSKYLRTLFSDEKTTQGYRKTENHEKNPLETLHAKHLPDGHGLGK
jgi:hypothetical protein